MAQELDDLPFQIDHIIARKHRGADNPENLALCCFADNNAKGPNLAGYDNVTCHVVRLFNPRRDRWSRHFAWRGAVMIGKTAIGRVTVEVLGINKPARVSLRASLIDEGRFP